MEIKNTNLLLLIVGAIVLVSAIIVGFFLFRDFFEESKENTLIKPETFKESETAKNSWRRGQEQDEFWVVNPNSNTELLVKLFYPQNFEENDSIDLLVLVPGGNSNSTSFTSGSKNAASLTEAGLAILIFDPDGRGESEGEENQNGYVQQDGLAAIIEFAAKDLPDAKINKIGVVSFSFGVSMASGALSRYPNLPVSFYIDWEGPVDRNDFAGCDNDRVGHLRNKVDCGDEAFFAEREAVNFIPKLEIPYWRLQSETDHAQPDVLSAVRAINAALGGSVPLVGLNENEIKASLSETAPPSMIPDVLDKRLMTEVEKIAEKLFSR
ncbi:MAG: hypothetical protein UX09_C0034G0004 [Candidatus Uhrbacteria bacterium GW2011_GWE2_45_35]|uniref:Serine aminopeptidase S33 domain-containing protein n=2 Tax=Candidatus Uhriibacteriota TaxID=1752732 RepID=A0A0G1MCF8_9BACT|nr:MAG: hypothetical protein UW63_C0052G0003 [Candidatus Uhrbacteria bacterium GW2011_GWF2_44_350]KKU07139.1 MAG: hypothetical protein UX09_C0034G0004 [Candidatus Uhrbacteria bacterium GW2011_GWE2_45_35]HBR80577.1 hypothetical protein [Candidatus Uhrbacteria bacterium]HCU31488.1 hypothetical protein [Candidatus Uhrbacteria bacterium]